MDEVGRYIKWSGFSSIVSVYCPFMHMPIIGMESADNWFMPIIDILRYVASYRLCFDCWLNHISLYICSYSYILPQNEQCACILYYYYSLYILYYYYSLYMSSFNLLYYYYSLYIHPLLLLVSVHPLCIIFFFCQIIFAWDS